LSIDHRSETPAGNGLRITIAQRIRGCTVEMLLRPWFGSRYFSAAEPVSFRDLHAFRRAFLTMHHGGRADDSVRLSLPWASRAFYGLRSMTEFVYFSPLSSWNTRCWRRMIRYEQVRPNSCLKGLPCLYSVMAAQRRAFYLSASYTSRSFVYIISNSGGDPAIIQGPLCDAVFAGRIALPGQ